MTDLAVIRATFSDWRTVKGRKQLQLIFEVPLEQQKEVLSRLGAPDSANPLWCAIALLDPDAPAPAMVEAAAMHKKLVSLQASERGKETYRQKDAMEQAAIRACILCDDLKFKLWASKQIPPGSDFPDATEWLRRRLGVKSRNEISGNDRAFQAFLALETQFKMDTGHFAELR